MSLLPTIGVYGSVCKHLGIEMRFPGTKIAYTSPMEVCDAHVLAEAMLFTSTEPGAANEGYNINNGDIFRWEQVWPQLGEFFGVKVGEPLRVGDLTQVMGGYKRVWEELVNKHGLKVSNEGVLYVIVCKNTASLSPCSPSHFRNSFFSSSQFRFMCQDIPYEKLATWKFMDFVFRMPEGGWFSNTLKLRRAGFHGMVVESGEIGCNNRQRYEI